MTAPEKAANHGLARTLAALVGAPLVALMVGAALVALLPVGEGSAFALGLHAVIPLWVALACGLPLMKNGWRAWGVCLAVALPLAVVLAVRSRG